MDVFAAVILGSILLVLLAVLMLIVHAQFCRTPTEGTEDDLGSMKPTRSELYQPSFSSVRLTID